MATTKTILVGCLARRIVANEEDREIARQHQEWITVACCDAVNREIGTIARLMDVEFAMDDQVERINRERWRIERERAKEATHG